MKRVTLGPGAAALVIAIAPNDTLAQQTPAPAAPPASRPFFVGNPLGLPVEPAAAGAFEGISSNVKVYGAIYSAESCSYDAERGVIVVPNRGVSQNVQANNAWIAFINHDGSVHTARWIGVQSPADRATLTPPLVLNDPFGSDIANGMLYVADRDGGTNANEPSVAVIRRFDMRTGARAGEFRVERSAWLNDLEVADDGTIYATQTGDRSANPDPATWQVWRITPDGTVSIFVQGAPLNQPNGVALDSQGNIVVVNMGNTEVLTFSRAGQLLKTENAVQAGNDGLVIMKDGTKYISSVLNGGVSRIRPGKPAELIARNIPSAASMCYDAGANQLVIPLNANNGLAFIRIE
ncbi:MAG: SMP-30/gluconolactonase/LRE family protein [Gemmatimonadaceae bacterium]